MSRIILLLTKKKIFITITKYNKGIDLKQISLYNSFYKYYINQSNNNLPYEFVYIIIYDKIKEIVISQKLIKPI